MSPASRCRSNGPFGWLDGRENVELASIQPNVPIDPAKFAKPAPPVAPAKR